VLEGSSQQAGALRLSRPLALLVCLASLHMALLVTSMVAGSKLVALPFHLSASATVLSYTLTFVILDTLAELYGPAVSKFVITMGLVGMIMAAGYMEIAALLPGPSGAAGQDAYAAVLSMSWRIWLAGWIAYTISQRLDVWSFLLLKRVGGIGASVAARAWFSLIFGQLIDTALFITIAFAGTTALLPVIAGQYAVKIVISTVTIPLVSVAVALGRRFITHDARATAIIAEETMSL
jgi:queuosine precursor transporter